MLLIIIHHRDTENTEGAQRRAISGARGNYDKFLRAGNSSKHIKIFEENFMKPLALRVMFFALALCASVVVTAQTAKRTLTIDDLLKVRRVGDPQLSPDGRLIAYQITDPDKAANRSRTQIYLIPIGGGEPVQLTSGDTSASSPRWSPDGKRIAFVRG